MPRFPFNTGNVVGWNVKRSRQRVDRQSERRHEILSQDFTRVHRLQLHSLFRHIGSPLNDNRPVGR